jgi:hypothetical protein
VVRGLLAFVDLVDHAGVGHPIMERLAIVIEKREQESG